MNTSEILQKSFDYIDGHLDVTFDEIPDFYLKLWKTPVPVREYLKRKDYWKAYEYRIFMHALNKYREKRPGLMPEEQESGLFEVFQQMLALSIPRNRQLPREAAFKVFDFELYFDLV
ncbi:MAG: hypothetical protein LBR65_06275 [Culturomica sp.]|jgi:hypothetical protein|nr:hypothetical protein [Culturomica sp.]